MVSDMQDTSLLDPKHVKKLAAAGRGGDTHVAHLTTGEVVLPANYMKKYPILKRMVEEAFKQDKLTLAERTVGDKGGTTNPKTGLEEFPSDGGSGGGTGGGAGAGDSGSDSGRGGSAGSDSFGGADGPGGSSIGGAESADSTAGNSNSNGGDTNTFLGGGASPGAGASLGAKDSAPSQIIINVGGGTPAPPTPKGKPKRIGITGESTGGGSLLGEGFDALGNAQSFGQSLSDPGFSGSKQRFGF